MWGKGWGKIKEGSFVLGDRKGCIEEVIFE